MKADIYPVLSRIERDLDSPFSQPKGPWWGIGEESRNARINATINEFDQRLTTASVDDLAAYAEGLKTHLQKAMEYLPGGLWTEYQSIIARCHKNLSFAFFALIVRTYDNKGVAFMASNYAAVAGITDFGILSSEVCLVAEDWGIFHSPGIAELLAGITGKQKPPQKEYYLLVDFPYAKEYLDYLVGSYLNKNYSLQDQTSKADASIIAYVISRELNISAYWKYFEAFWSTDGLRDAFRQCKTRGNKDATRTVLHTMLRKPMQGVPGDTEDTDKVRKYLNLL